MKALFYQGVISQEGTVTLCGLVGTGACTVAYSNNWISQFNRPR